MAYIPFSQNWHHTIVLSHLRPLDVSGAKDCRTLWILGESSLVPRGAGRLPAYLGWDDENLTI